MSAYRITNVSQDEERYLISRRHAGIVPMPGLSSAEIDGRHTDEFTLDIQKLMQRITEAKSMTVTEVFEHIYKGSVPRLYEFEGYGQL